MYHTEKVNGLVVFLNTIFSQGSHSELCGLILLLRGYFWTEHDTKVTLTTTAAKWINLALSDKCTQPSTVTKKDQKM